MRNLYTLLMYLALPLTLLYLAWRGIRDRDYARRWSERFGRFRGGQRGGIVLHAASFGEVNAAAPLISALLKHAPGLPLTITTFTPTGSRRVRSAFGKRVFHVYAPLDLPGSVGRFFKRLQPRLLVVLETEIWPNLYGEAGRLGVPVLLSNARLSARSVGAFQRLASLSRGTLAHVTWAGAQTTEDRDRLIACGLPAHRTEVAGNLKFDVSVSPTLTEESVALRSAWGSARPVLTAGSSRAGDEAILLPAFRKIQQVVPDALLILVPRHPERFAEAARKARAAGLRVALRSESATASPEVECYVIDTMGELMRYYACCDVAFVGGTFANIGGHNLLEPAALGKPVLFGPHTHNIEEIAQQLSASGGGLKLQSEAELTAAVLHWFEDRAARARAGSAAQALVENNRGALDRNLAAVMHYLEHA
jgi:3-deoxy-D-manno-octulosonic-acid transferase